MSFDVDLDETNRTKSAKKPPLYLHKPRTERKQKSTLVNNILLSFPSFSVQVHFPPFLRHSVNTFTSIFLPFPLVYNLTSLFSSPSLSVQSHFPSFPHFLSVQSQFHLSSSFLQCKFSLHFFLPLPSVYNPTFLLSSLSLSVQSHFPLNSSPSISVKYLVPPFFSPPLFFFHFVKSRNHTSGGIRANVLSLSKYACTIEIVLFNTV